MAALWRRRIGPADAVAYWIAQFVAGVLAGWVAHAVVNPTDHHTEIEQLADAELDRPHDRLPDLSEQQRAETAATVHRILRKILHRPTVRAKELTTGPDGPVYLDALRRLFDLDTGAGDPQTTASAAAASSVGS
jgi:glutamyl-tRNA reductase